MEPVRVVLAGAVVRVAVIEVEHSLWRVGERGRENTHVRPCRLRSSDHGHKREEPSWRRELRWNTFRCARSRR